MTSGFWHLYRMSSSPDRITIVCPIRIGPFLRPARNNSHRYERLRPIPLSEGMVFTAAHRLVVEMTVRRAWTDDGIGRRENRVRYPQCRGISAAELAAALDQLVGEKTVIEDTECHYDDVDSSMGAYLLPEEKTAMAEASDD